MNLDKFKLTDSTIEYCDICHDKLLVQRVYFGGNKFCLNCYLKEINKMLQYHVDWVCPNCGYKNKSDYPPGINSGAF